MATIACLFLFTITMIMAYSLRSSSEPKSFEHSHAVYIIRTIWKGSFIALAFIIIGGVYMFFNVDNAPLASCMSLFIDLAPTLEPDQLDAAALTTIFKPCVGPYMAANKTVLTITAITMIAPAGLYFVWNYGLGLKKAIQLKAIG